MPHEKFSEDISSLLTFENENAATYARLIQFAEAEIPSIHKGGAGMVAHAEMWRIYFEAGVELKEAVKGKPFIDLGGGSLSVMSEIAKEYGASAYYNVERYPSGEDPQTNIIRADMLDFISRLQPLDATFAMNAIDIALIPSVEYHRALATELTRVTKSGSVVFGNNAEALRYLEQEQFLSVMSTNRGGAIINGAFIKK